MNPNEKRKNNFWRGNKPKRFRGNNRRMQQRYQSPEYQFPYYQDWRPNSSKYGNNQQFFQSNDAFPPTPPLFTHFSTEVPKEHIEPQLVGPGSNTERMEKVMATKKRLEEALAAKSPVSNSQDIPLNNSVNNIKEKTVDKGLHANIAATLELELTNSDFKEIGSVASSAVGRVEPEETDLLLNISPSSCQQRSFNNTGPSPVTAKMNNTTSENRPSRASRWNVSEINQIVLEPTSNQPRGSGELYYQGSVETILGDIEPLAENHQPDLPSSPKNYQNNEFAEVGRLYQSFLKSRYRGYTLKVKLNKNKTNPSVSNPYLDKSVLDNQNSVPDEILPQSNHVLELQMPHPIQVKMEINNLNGSTQTNSPDDIEALEANKFCEEFSYLLTHPNYLIPPEDLQKLGLGHLSEMNKLIDEQRPDNSFPIENHISQADDIAVDRPTADSSSSGPNNRAKPGSINFNGLNNSSALPGNLTTTSTTDQNISVETVVEKVVERLFQSKAIKTQQSGFDIQTLLGEGAMNQDKVTNQNTLPASNCEISFDQMQSISSKILRLFLIDKQISELITEKNKIYTELLSAKEVSSTLFNSWAQDQIQQGNVMNVVASNSSLPDLNKLLNSNITNLQPPNISNTKFSLDSIYEAFSNTLFLPKKEEINSVTAVQTEKVEVDEPETVGTDKVTEEINRPKLSVRKDLLDPNLLVDLNKTSPPDTGSLNNLHNETSNDNSNFNKSLNETKKEKSKSKTKKKDLMGESLPKKSKIQAENTKKKNKKSKKKEVNMEIIDLVGDSSDEELNSLSSIMGDPPTSDDPSTRINADMGPTKANQKITTIALENVATSMTVLKRALLVGCKDGKLMVFGISSGEQHLGEKLHQDSIVSIHVVSSISPSKYVLTGSTDSSICVYSLKCQSRVQTIPVNSPVQCCDVDNNKAYFGTRTGYILTYKIQMINESDHDAERPLLEEGQPPQKVTNSCILAVRAAKEGVRCVLILACRGEQICVRDAVNGLLLRTFDWSDTVYCLQLYSATPYVYCGTNNSGIKIVNFATGENSSNDCISWGRCVIQIAFLDTVLFAACYDGKVYAYDVEDQMLITSVNAPKGLIVCIAICKQKIIVASNRDEIQAIAFPAELKMHIKHKKSTKQPS